MNRKKNWAGAVFVMIAVFLPHEGKATDYYSTNIPVKIIEGSESRQFNQLMFEAAKKGLTEDVKILLTKGASVEARDRIGNTALLLAALSGKHHTVMALLDAGSDVHHQNLKGSTALYRAAKNGRKRSIRLLLKAGADINQPNDKGLTPLIAAAYNGDDRLVKKFLEIGADPSVIDSYGKSAAVYAAGRGFYDIVGILLDTGIDVNKRYGNKLTMLMWAAGYSDDVPPEDGNITVIKLLERGADVTFRDNRGWTALSTAAYRNHGNVIHLLVAAGANPSVRSKLGKTPLDLARAANSQKAAQAITEEIGG